MKRALTYQFPAIYNGFVSILDRNLKEKYRFIAEIIGKDKKVFELGCGTALLAEYLDKSCSYTGWDMNEKFVDYCRRKGLKVFKENIFDFEKYPESDVIVILDVLHHIVPQDKKLIQEAKKRTKKLIVSEPSSGLACGETPSRLYKFYDKFFGDNDGINDLENRKDWKFANQEELINYFKDLGAQKIIFLGKRKTKFVAIF